MKKTDNLGPLADAYGMMNAEIADIVLRQNVVREQIIATGKYAIEGEVFRVSVSHGTRTSADPQLRAKIKKLIEAHLSAKFVKAHTKVKNVVTIKPVARLREAA